MKNIIVATDFSNTADNATNYAADMARAIKGKLLLLHVYQVPVSYMEVPMPVFEENFMDDAEDAIEKLREELLLRTNNEVEISTELRMGFFHEELKEICGFFQPYAVIMGSQGKTAAENFLFGGHSVYAMKYLDWPLITVPPSAKFEAIKKIGLACDFDDVVETTPADEIKHMVTDFNAELHIVNTGKNKVIEPREIFESGMMQEMLGVVHPEYHFITTPDIDSGILEFCDKNHIDLLIVLPKRRDFIERLLHRSHTKHFVLHSHVPVMALHD